MVASAVEVVVHTHQENELHEIKQKTNTRHTGRGGGGFGGGGYNRAPEGPPSQVLGMPALLTNSLTTTCDDDDDDDIPPANTGAQRWEASCTQPRARWSANR